MVDAPQEVVVQVAVGEGGDLDESNGVVRQAEYAPTHRLPDRGGRRTGRRHAGEDELLDQERYPAGEVDQSLEQGWVG